MARGFSDADRYFAVRDEVAPTRGNRPKLSLVTLQQSNEDDGLRQKDPASILTSPTPTARFTKLSNRASRGSELLDRYYHKQDDRQMRGELGACFWMRQSALILYYHRYAITYVVLNRLICVNLPQVVFKCRRPKAGRNFLPRGGRDRGGDFRQRNHGCGL